MGKALPGGGGGGREAEEQVIIRGNCISGGAETYKAYGDLSPSEHLTYIDSSIFSTM